MTLSYNKNDVKGLSHVRGCWRITALTMLLNVMTQTILFKSISLLPTTMLKRSITLTRMLALSLMMFLCDTHNDDTVTRLRPPMLFTLVHSSCSEDRYLQDVVSVHRDARRRQKLVTSTRVRLFRECTPSQHLNYNDRRLHTIRIKLLHHLSLVMVGARKHVWAQPLHVSVTINGLLNHWL